MNLSGGSKVMKSKKSVRLKIIGDSPEMTDDIKETISYLENIVINKETIKKIDSAELVKQINRLIQYVQVLSIYKKPFFNLIKAYNNACMLIKSHTASLSVRRYNQIKRDVIFNALNEVDIQNMLERKEFWEDYE